MKVALLSPIAWRTPPQHYGPWEQVVATLANSFVKRGVDVTLFATGNSSTLARLEAVVSEGYEENIKIRTHTTMWNALHIANCFEKASTFDLIHNHFDYLPLTYTQFVKTPVVTTIHGFSSPEILRVYKKYNHHVYYVAISRSDMHQDLTYIAQIYHGINLEEFTFSQKSGNYLIFFGRIHHDKGTSEAIQIARRFGMKLIICGIIQDQKYYKERVLPYLDSKQIEYKGSVEPKERNILLSQAYALVHPIQFAEPFGLSVIESLACGTPVVAFRRGSMSEIIRHGKTGFLVDNLEQAVKVLPKISTLKRSACRADVASRFSAQRMVDDYLKVYEKILAEKNKS